jgi:hypothetical protein
VEPNPISSARRPGSRVNIAYSPVEPRATGSFTNLLPSCHERLSGRPMFVAPTGRVFLIAFRTATDSIDGSLRESHLARVAMFSYLG